ncbi:MAG: 50S ribosomal protein L1 [Candidatus Kerfeldbacteria bacterium]|nr:50S ribosomal protein L1 [Candidatus Kerfeldbacteria bacterium]
MSSKRWRAAAQLIDQSKTYALPEAIGLLKQTATTKFDASVEAHIRLGVDPSKADQGVRATVELPHGTGKKLRIAVFAKGPAAKAAQEAGADIVGDADLIATIKKTEKVDFDIAIATPDMMKLLAPVAKILGTKGLMPNPKAETVAADPAKAVLAWKKGKLAFRADNGGNLHAMIGKVSFSEQQLTENWQTLLEAIKKAKPSETKGTYIKSVTLTTSMGPGMKLAL